MNDSTATTLEQFRLNGLFINKLAYISGTLDYEAPIHILSPMIGNCYVGSYSFIGGGGKFRNVTIGRFCSIAPDVTVGLTEHPTDWLSTHPFQYGDDRRFAFYSKHTAALSLTRWPTQKRTNIGNDVWIGARSIIKQGINVGDGSIVGANSVVTRDVEPYSIVGGSPARHIRYRFSEDVISKLIILKWWEYDIFNIQSDFSNPEAVINYIKTQRPPIYNPDRYLLKDGMLTLKE